jgi:alkanesulfonate monooxygenase SsuD/methylene tetrahydromethanopterin reductase-like flavin-dependent oxidoreductase (luciferase family)
VKVSVILDPGTAPAEAKTLGELAEQFGLEAVWASNYPSSRDPFMVLAPLALSSARIRMGPLVMTPWELHPYKLSKAILGLAELTGGRANVLIGGPTGVPGVMGMDPRQMVGRVRECVEIVRGARPDAPLNYKGRHYQVWGYKPAWAIAPPPEIWIAANKPQMVAMATRLADGIMLGDMTPPRLTECLARVGAGLEAVGRTAADVRVSSLVAWHVKSDARASIAEARSELALRGMLEDWYVASFLDADECRLVQSRLPAFFRAYKSRSPEIEGVPESILDKLVANLTLSGDESSLDRHIERLNGFAAAGLTDVALKLHGDQLQAVRLIGERVAPALAGAGPPVS